MYTLPEKNEEIPPNAQLSSDTVSAFSWPQQFQLQLESASECTHNNNNKNATHARASANFRIYSVTILSCTFHVRSIEKEKIAKASHGKKNNQCVSALLFYMYMCQYLPVRVRSSSRFIVLLLGIFAFKNSFKCAYVLSWWNFVLLC